MVKFTVGDRPFKLTKREVTQAMRLFNNQFRGRQADFGTGYAVMDEKGSHYPPKQILRLALRQPRLRFYGGEQTNRPLRDLNFKIAKVTRKMRIGRPDWRTPPTPDEMVRRLFAQKWKRLPTDFSPLPINNSEYPGIYAIGYKNGLEDKRVTESDVFYIGMSQAGLRKRLVQFIKGLQDGHHHCAAKHFFYNHAHGQPYSNLRGKKPFYIAAVPLPCVTQKVRRTAAELEKMGIVAAAEYCAIARVKKATGREPKLNVR